MAGGLTTALSGEVERLRKANPSCSAEFALHATLLAGLGDRSIDPDTLHDVAKQVVHNWKTDKHGLNVKLKDVETRGSYFQCIVVSLIPEPDLLELYRTCKSAVDQHFPPSTQSTKAQEYFPHISLLYAPLSTSQAQAQINTMHDKAIFTHTPNTQGIHFKGFTQTTFASLDIVNYTGPPQDWHTLYSIPL